MGAIDSGENSGTEEKAITYLTKLIKFKIKY